MSDAAVTYIPDAQYERLVAALESVKPCAWTGDTETQIKLALVEHGICPASTAH